MRERAIAVLVPEVREQHVVVGALPGCEDRAPVELLVFFATQERNWHRWDTMRALPEHDAKVTHIDSCRSPNNGDCRQALLRVMGRCAMQAGGLLVPMYEPWRFTQECAAGGGGEAVGVFAQRWMGSII